MDMNPWSYVTHRGPVMLVCWLIHHYKTHENSSSIYHKPKNSAPEISQLRMLSREMVIVCCFCIYHIPKIYLIHYITLKNHCQVRVTLRDLSGSLKNFHPMNMPHAADVYQLVTRIITQNLQNSTGAKITSGMSTCRGTTRVSWGNLGVWIFNQYFIRTKPVLHPNPYFGKKNAQDFAGNLRYQCTPLNFYGFGSSRYGI